MWTYIIYRDGNATNVLSKTKDTFVTFNKPVGTAVTPLLIMRHCSPSFYEIPTFEFPENKALTA